MWTPSSPTRVNTTTSLAWPCASSDLPSRPLGQSSHCAPAFAPAEFEAHNFLMKARELAESICARLREAGYKALFNGGCVRDLILGREPADYDICTDATPERVQQLFPGSLA